MNIGSKPTESIERKNIPDNKIANKSNLRILKIIPYKISSSKDIDKKSCSRANNEIQTKNKFIVTTDYSIKDKEKKM
jgi:hypothetical protein